MPCLLCVQATGDTGFEAGDRDVARLRCRAKALVNHVEERQDLGALHRHLWKPFASRMRAKPQVPLE